MVVVNFYHPTGLCIFLSLIPNKLGGFFEKGVKKANNIVTVLPPYAPRKADLSVELTD
jgi:hypothetical protein